MQEFSIATLLTRAREGWRTPLVFAIVLAMFTLLSLIGSRPVYRVTMSIVPAPSDQGAQAMMPTSGALTTLLGMGSGGNINFMRYQKLLSSPVVAQRLQDHYGMLQLVFAGNWDKSRKTWVQTKTARFYMVSWLLRLSNLPTWAPPDVTALAKYLEGSLVLVPATTSDIVTVTMDDTDVEFAKKVMLAAHAEANQVLRDQVALRARQQVAYLQGKLAETSVQDYRATLLAMLGNQEKTLMLTQTDASYAAEILSPPMASPTPVAPRPVLGLFIAVLVGLMSGLTVVIFLGPEWWRTPLEKVRGFFAGRRKTLAARH
jgi:hypothetical protein